MFKFTKNLLMFSLIALSLSGCAGSYQAESTGQFIDNSAVTVKVKQALLSDEQVKSLPIKVKTYKGVVQLSGFVDSQMQAERAAQIASQVAGVTLVKNHLLIKQQ